LANTVNTGEVAMRRQYNNAAGESLFAQLSCSAFGQFQEAMQGLSDVIDLKRFQLPQVVVVGTESSGKSSLLEKLTKCPVFPRDANICTKMPVRVVMEKCKSESEYKCVVEHKGQTVTLTCLSDDILEVVSKFMRQYDENTLIKEELVIKIKSPNVLTFTLIDLPGLRSYPENLKTLSTEISKKYLLEENTLVLCVVPATTTRLTSNQAIGLLLELGKTKEAILALSMADHVAERKDILYSQLFDRLTGCSNELYNVPFGGCVGVVNRASSDTRTLEEADADETSILRNIIYKADPPIQETVHRCLGIKSLLYKLDKFYSSFIADV
jgi:GTP-binding protein EngB required for normal cell division